MRVLPVVFLLIQETQPRVLFIEAISDNHLFIRMPAGVAKNYRPKSWPYETEPEPHVNNRKCKLPKGKYWGSSSVNGMIISEDRNKIMIIGL